MNANLKWERDLLPEKILAKRYFSRVENICRDNKVREFYFKLLHRIVVSKRELFTYGIAKHVLCPYCKQNDSIIHTFCNCHRTLIMIERIKVHRKLSKSSILLFCLLNITCTQISQHLRNYLWINLISWRYDFEKPLSSLRGDRIQLTRISCKLTGLILSCELLQLLYHSFSFLCNFGPICNIVI